MTAHRFSEAIVAHRWLVMLATLAWVAAVGYGGRLLSFNADSRVFFSADNPQLVALEAFENTYSREDHLLFVLAPREGDVFTREALAAIEELTEASWQVPYSSRVDSMTNHQHIEAEADDLLVFPLVRNAASLSDADIERVRGIALGSPRLAGRLLNGDGTVTAVAVTLPSKPRGDVGAALEVADHAREMAAGFAAKYPGIDIHLVGSVMFDVAFLEVPQQELRTLIPLMFVLIVLIIGLGLGTLWGAIGTLLIILMSVVTALGAAGWFGVVINAGNTSAAIIVMTLAVAHCVHVISTVQLARRDGADQYRSVVDALRINLTPMIITSATTAIGFMSLNFSDTPPFRSLGNISAAGIMFASVLSMTFLPSFLALAPSRRRAGQARSRLAMEAFAEFLIEHRTPVLWGTGVGIAVLLLGIGRITLDDNFITYFPERYPVRASADFTENNLTGLNALAYSMPAGGTGAIADPNYLADLENLAEWFRAQPKVSHVSTFSSIMKELNQHMNGADPDYFRVPDDRELAAQYLLLYELSLPYGLDLNDQIDISKSSTRFTVSVADITSSELRDLDRRAQAWMPANTSLLPGPATGLSVAYAHMSERNINAMLLGSVLALVLISFVLIFALRSVTMGLVSLLPNLMPAGIAFGLWGYVKGEVGLAISTVLAMTLGIVVDDTVHFLSKYLRARREHGMRAPMACLFAFGTVGPALWVTSLTLCAGFGVLGLSGFKVNSDMGILSAATIALALVTDFVFLPAILIRFDKRPLASAGRGRG